jgi:hypothetical protein
MHWILITLAVSVGARHGLAQGVILTYQGRVLDRGVGFSGTGLFKFALVAGVDNNEPATGEAFVNNGFVTSYAIDDPGSGYSTTPLVTVWGGGGSGATATATVSGGSVISINPVTAGSGYTALPTVLIAPPPADVCYTTYWSNDGSSVGGSEPALAVSVPVSNGLFTVSLGDAILVNMGSIDPSVFAQPSLQLRIWFNDGVQGSKAMSPVQSLTPAPYAVTAMTTDSAATATTAITASSLSTPPLHSTSSTEP